MIRDGRRYSCSPADGHEAEGLCAEASLEKLGYVDSSCKRVENAAQDRCAATSIRKNGYIDSSCFSL